MQTAAKQAPADTGEYLAGTNESVINADLQTRLKGMVETASGPRARFALVGPDESGGISDADNTSGRQAWPRPRKNLIEGIMRLADKRDGGLRAQVLR